MDYKFILIHRPVVLGPNSCFGVLRNWHVTGLIPTEIQIKGICEVIAGHNEMIEEIPLGASS